MKPDFISDGSWTSKSNRLPNLGVAAIRLREMVASSRAREDAGSARYEALATLQAVLETLPRGECSEMLEAVSIACHEADYHQTRSYLEFLYMATHDLLVKQVSWWLWRSDVESDVESTASDLVANLFSQMMEALLDDPDGEGSHKLPPPGRVMKWMRAALHNDVRDHRKAAAQRLERSIQVLPDEHYEQALDRCVGRHEQPQELLPLEQSERREAFLSVFEKATSHLRARHQDVLRLREVENATTEQIAEFLQLPVPQVRDLLQYGREKRASILASMLEHHPVFADLNPEGMALEALLKRVRLWGIARGLEPRSAATMPRGS